MVLHVHQKAKSLQIPYMETAKLQDKSPQHKSWLLMNLISRPLPSHLNGLGMRLGEGIIVDVFSLRYGYLLQLLYLLDHT